MKPEVLRKSSRNQLKTDLFASLNTPLNLLFNISVSPFRKPATSCKTADSADTSAAGSADESDSPLALDLRQFQDFENGSADSADTSAEASADESDSPPALDIRQFQDFNNGSADSADTSQVSSKLDAASTHGAENLIDAHQQYQHSSSSGLNPVVPSTVAAAQPSALVSAPSAVDEPVLGSDPAAATNKLSAVDNQVIAPTVQELATQILLCQTWVAGTETTAQVSQANPEVSLAPTKPEQSTHPEVFQRGQRVRVKLAGSQRDGKTGVVRSAIAEGEGIKYEVWLDDASIRRDLRKMVCFPGWLEAIAL